MPFTVVPIGGTSVSLDGLPALMNFPPDMARVPTEVNRLSTDGAGGRRFHLETSQGPLDADDVIVATGAFHVPKIPAAAAGFSPRLRQLHAHHYRDQSELPPGGVLIVGSGSITHNLRLVFSQRPHAQTASDDAPEMAESAAFRNWFASRSAAADSPSVPCPNWMATSLIMEWRPSEQMSARSPFWKICSTA